jgi:uncharacterized protein (TIGR02145 family)
VIIVSLDFAINPTPTVDDDKSLITNPAKGQFTKTITGLSSNTKYYLRPFCKDGGTYIYGDIVEAKTAKTTLTDVDNNTYNAVEIGTQVWMQENLKVVHYRNGDDIANVADNSAWSNLTTGAYCWYDNSIANKEVYGAMYNFYATVDNRILCPTGWHAPSDAEWTTLSEYLGGDEISGGKMKEYGLLHWLSPNNEASNSSGFTAFPGGYRVTDGTFNSLGEEGKWWSTTTNDATTSWYRYIYNTYTTLFREYFPKANGLSIRCIQGEIFSLPTVTTKDISLFTSSTATGGGNVTADGGNEVTARGVCWSTNQNPTIDLPTKTVDDSGLGSFTSSITGLTVGTTYFVRAYATNSIGTAYGNEVSFTTSAEVPTLTTSVITALASTSVNSGGDITSSNGAEVTARGVCWGTSTNPVATGSYTIDASGTGTFISNISGLNASTTYFLRAYATNSAGTGYGNEVSFTTTIQVVDRDGNTYNTVQIGTQIWMQENLKVTQYRNGDAIPNITANASWASLTTGAYCWYSNNEATYKTIYGGLYNYFATVDNRNLCPTGWHVPTDAELSTLETYLGGSSVAGGKMKEVGYSHWTTPNVGADNTSGFSALPSGSRKPDGNFYGISGSSYIWSTTNYDETNVWYRWLSYTYASLSRNYNNAKPSGNSVRCLQGEGQVLPAVTTTTIGALASTSVTSGGNVLSDGGASVTARGVCWSASSGPTVALVTKTTDGNGTGSFISSVTGLLPNTVYFVRAYATNSVGTAYGNEVSLTTNQPVIGDPYQGGKVAYIFQSGDPGYIAGQVHGLIVALSDIDETTGTVWSNISSTAVTGTSTSLGTGQANTNKIISQSGHTLSAASVCDSYTNTETGTGVYSDWYLPSRDELIKVNINMALLGSFPWFYYWSSSEYNATDAWYVQFAMGSGQANLVKSGPNGVRPVRTF